MCCEVYCDEITMKDSALVPEQLQKKCIRTESVVKPFFHK